MKKILIIDIETTGFLNAGGKIVEVGICSLELETGKIEKVYDQVTHERGVTLEEVQNSWIIEHSDLTADKIRFSIAFDLQKDMIQRFINLYPDGATAYNNRFDFEFLESRGINFPKKLACPMIISTPILKLKKRNGSAGHKWPSVEEAYHYFFPDEDYVEKHRGFDDCVHEAKIVKKLFDLGKFKVH